MVTIQLPVKLALAAVFVLGGFLGYRQIFSPDIGFHLETGRWISEHLAVPRTDSFTYTFTGQPYVDLQWLYQLGLWWTYHFGGTLAVTVGNLALTLLTSALLVWRTARRQGALSVWVPLFLLLFVMGDLWEVRPHVLSWIYLNLLLLTLETYRRRPDRRIWWLPVIMLMWVNTHALFSVGWAALGCFAAPELWRGRQADRRLLLAVALAAAVCVLNPYGVTGLLFPLQQLEMLQPGSPFKTGPGTIVELLSPLRLDGYTANGSLVLLQPLLFQHLYLVAVLIGVFARRRPWCATETLLVIAFGYAFAIAQRNFGFFVIASLPVAVAGWTTLFPGRAALQLWAFAGTVTTLCALFAAQTATGWLYAQQHLPLRVGHNFDDQFLPVGAAEFVRDHLPPGRMLNGFGEGGYLRFVTGCPVFIDGRGAPMAGTFYSDYVRAQTPRGLREALLVWRPDIAVVTFNNNPVWFEFFENRTTWRCVYADERDVVYLRAGFAPDIPVLVPPASPKYTLDQLEALLAKAGRWRNPGLWSTVARRHYYPLTELRFTAFHLLRRHPEAAIWHGLRGLDRATIPCPDILNNLMQAFIAVKDYPRAWRCYQALPVRARDPRLGGKLQRMLAGQQQRPTAQPGDT